MATDLRSYLPRMFQPGQNHNNSGVPNNQGYSSAGPGGNQPTGNQNQGPGGNQPTNQPNNPGANQPGGNQSGNNAPGSTTSGQQNSPLDAFKDLWQTPQLKDGQKPITDPFTEPLFQTDPAKIAEAAGKMDFLSTIPQELMARASSGTDPKALFEMMQHVAQQSLATALQVSTSTIEQAGSRMGTRFNSAFPNKFRESQINSTPPSHPVLQHPAAQKMLEMARRQMASMNPDANAEQVNAMAEEYFTTFAQQMMDLDPNKPVPPKDPQEQNWLSWGSS